MKYKLFLNDKMTTHTLLAITKNLHYTGIKGDWTSESVSYPQKLLKSSTRILKVHWFTFEKLMLSSC